MRVLLLGLLLQAGCVGYGLAGLHRDEGGAEIVQVPPLESGVQLSCAGAPCSAVPLQKPWKNGRSRGVFWTVFAGELALGVTGYAFFFKSVNTTDPNLGAALGSGMLGAASFGLASVDILAYLLANDFGRQEEPLRLAKPVMASWNGRAVPIRISDLVGYGETTPGESFSVAAAATRAPAPAPAPARSGKIAVLEVKSGTRELSAQDARYFTDVIRGAVLKAAPQLEVITRENLLVLLKSADLASCEGECEVETGRRIGADQIVSGELAKIGTRFKLSLRLHETHDGRLLGATVASGSTVDELDQAASQAVTSLFK